MMQRNCDRIAKDMELLVNLVAIGEQRQSMIKNRTVTTLTTVATVFLPFSTIATVLGMQGDYAPGEAKFWVVWAVSVPITVAIMLVYLAYNATLGSAVSRLFGHIPTS